MIVNQLSIFLENQPGQLKNVVSTFMGNDIQIIAVSAAEKDEYGVIRFIVDDYKKACEVLDNNKYIYQTIKIIVVNINDDLLKMLDILKADNINVEYMYSIPSKKANTNLMAFRVDNPEKFEEKIKENNHYNLSKEDIGLI